MKTTAVVVVVSALTIGGIIPAIASGAAPEPTPSVETIDETTPGEPTVETEPIVEPEPTEPSIEREPATTAPTDQSGVDERTSAEPPAAELDTFQAPLLDEGGIGITPFQVGAEPAAGPFIYWEARSTASGNALIGGAIFEIQGPRTGATTGNGAGSDARWNHTTAIVEDNVGQPGYAGPDLDPDPGEFQVQWIDDHQVSDDNRYRIRKQTAPAGYSLGSTNWATTPGTSTNSNSPHTTAWTGNPLRWEPSDFTFTPNQVRSHTIHVNKGDLRTGITGGTSVNVSGTYAVGARFGLYTTQTSTAPVATCVITSGSTCTFSGVNASGVLWVGELDPAPGTPAATNYSAPLTTLTTGGTTFTDRPYRYATPSLSSSSNQTVTVPAAPSNDDDWDESSGRYANRLANPQLALSCTAGVNIALVMDLSGSVQPFRNQLRDAAKGFVDSLLNTGSSVALFSFGNVSPRAGTSNYATPVVVNAAGQTTLHTRIDNYWTNTTTNQGTNWDAGLWQAAQGAASHDYDIVFVLTDGNPTFSATNSSGSSEGAGAGNFTTFRELERAIFSANVIKNEGTRVVTVGIGGNLSDHNLAAISGPQGYSAGLSLNDVDYTTAGWSELASLLEDFAAGLTCQATVNVTKLTSEDGAAPEPASGWEFAASKSGAGTIVGTNPDVTDDDGTVSWTIQFTQPTQTATSLALEETLPLEGGWALDDVVCTVNDQSREFTLSGTTATLGGAIGIGDRVDCTFTNVRASAATVQADKTWIVADAAGTTLATYYDRGDDADPPVPSWLIASPTITGIAPAPSITEPEWGTPYAGFTQGQQVNIGETASIDTTAHPGCTLASQQLTIANGQPVDPPTDVSGGGLHTATLVGGANTFGITNTVTCSATLTLVKVVDETTVAVSAAVATDWALSATAAGEQTIEGDTGVSGAVAPDVTYSLGEQRKANASDDSALYTPANPAWVCELDGDGTLDPGDWNATGSVSVPLGQSVTCTITNETAELTLLKYVDGDADPDNWQLSATAADGNLPARDPIAGGWEGDVNSSGAAQADSANTVIVRPGESYALTEASADPNISYLFEGVQRWNPATSAWEDVADPTAITVGAGGHEIYRFVNASVPLVVLPLTGGLSTDAFLIAGGAVLLGALSLALWHRSRTVRYRRTT